MRKRSSGRSSEGNYASLLRKGIEFSNLVVSDEAQKKLLAYVDMLVKWNRIYNLTAVRKPYDMVIRHILDSLAVVPYLDSGRVLDVGTGAGLPGIVLALACPDNHLILLDSSDKKLRFVKQVVAELELDNVTVVSARDEEYKPEEKVDVIISRALLSLDTMVQLAARVCNSDVQLLAMKGVYPMTEIEALEDQSVVEEVVTLDVPFLDAERHLVIMRYTDEEGC
ncbi:MAG: 16S rRNA (guanine(527)-N(7))-methyltransferase RsmG [Gammaproteobacteria bacterium]|nr:16S rRNA (guanine(527)-N(7))-methyltransferase RsmG [Gammaproteobacteria bacterium]